MNLLTNLSGGKVMRIHDRIIEHIRNNSSIYLFVIILLLMGVIFGATIVNSLHSELKQDLLFYLKQFFSQADKDNIGEPSVVWKESYISQLMYISIIWVLGISIIGLPIILFLLFLKGIVVGFTVGFLVDQMGIEGFLLAMVSVLPQNLIVIPIYIFISTISIGFSIQLIKQLFIKKQTNSILPELVGYSFLFLIVGIILLVSSCFEGYISPKLMKFVINLM